MMQNCSGLVTTAGFESVSEAMSLGKPVLMIPVLKHFEQACNALDAERAGAGIIGNNFSNLTDFLSFLPNYENISPKFNYWHSQADRIFVKEFEKILSKNVVEKGSFFWENELIFEV